MSTNSPAPNVTTRPKAATLPSIRISEAPSRPGPSRTHTTSSPATKSSYTRDAQRRARRRSSAAARARRLSDLKKDTAVLDINTSNYSIEKKRRRPSRGRDTGAPNSGARLSVPEDLRAIGKMSAVEEDPDDHMDNANWHEFWDERASGATAGEASGGGSAGSSASGAEPRSSAAGDGGRLGVLGHAVPARPGAKSPPPGVVVYGKEWIKVGSPQ